MKDFVRGGQKTSTKTARQNENGLVFKRGGARALACELHTESHAGLN
jgi:hypothetical protein